MYDFVKIVIYLTWGALKLFKHVKKNLNRRSPNNRVAVSSFPFVKKKDKTTREI